jgi:LemA protein
MTSLRIETLESIARLRSAAGGSAFDEVRLEAESELTGALRHLWVMVNAHPELRASAEFQALARNLEHVEESLRNARRRYNSTVRDYNYRIQKFPGNFMAALLGLRPKPLLDLSCLDEGTRAAADPRQHS